MLEAIVALVTTSFLLLGSPGPAPLALAATGASHGFKNGIPFLLGILSGLAVAMVGAVIGISSILANFPEVKLGIQIAGGVYICYIAFKIATAPVLENGADNLFKRPNFRDGFILNALNPKAYAAFLAIFSGLLLPLTGVTASIMATGVTCFLVAVIVDILWLCFGDLLRPVFSKPEEARVLRVTFSVLMVVSVALALRI